MKSDCKIEYHYFIFFSLAVLKEDTERAIHCYGMLRSHAKELIDFEEDLFNLLPINNNQTLNTSIKLIDLSLGITRRNKN